MSYQPRFDKEFDTVCFKSSRTVGTPAETTGTPSLTAAIAQLDCAISMSPLPELAAFDGRDAVTDANLFLSGTEDETEAPANFLRVSPRSRLARSRVVALRRRQMRSHLQRAQVQWPLAGGQDEGELARLRDCLYPEVEEIVEERPSTQMRLATHAISLSLVATALPIGAAVMTYNLLKGEDMRVTARLTTLTGLALAIFAGNPALGQLVGL